VVISDCHLPSSSSPFPPKVILNFQFPTSPYPFFLSSDQPSSLLPSITALTFSISDDCVAAPLVEQGGYEDNPGTELFGKVSFTAFIFYLDIPSLDKEFECSSNAGIKIPLRTLSRETGISLEACRLACMPMPIFV
jgi:hypothetical protein